jgi:hypothetical protein
MSIREQGTGARRAIRDKRRRPSVGRRGSLTFADGAVADVCAPQACRLVGEGGSEGRVLSAGS